MNLVDRYAALRVKLARAAFRLADRAIPDPDTLPRATAKAAACGAAAGLAGNLPLAALVVAGAAAGPVGFVVAGLGGALLTGVTERRFQEGLAPDCADLAVRLVARVERVRAAAEAAPAPAPAPRPFRSSMVFVSPGGVG